VNNNVNEMEKICENIYFLRDENGITLYNSKYNLYSDVFENNPNFEIYFEDYERYVNGVFHYKLFLLYVVMDENYMIYLDEMFNKLIQPTNRNETKKGSHVRVEGEGDYNYIGDYIFLMKDLVAESNRLKNLNTIYNETL